jgi:hypothetical protein
MALVWCASRHALEYSSQYSLPDFLPGFASDSSPDLLPGQGRLHHRSGSGAITRTAATSLRLAAGGWQSNADGGFCAAPPSTTLAGERKATGPVFNS